MKRPYLLSLFAILLVFGTLAGVKVMQIRKMISAGASFQPPPESVATTTVEEVVWKTTLNAVGTLQSMRGITLAAEVSGVVQEIGFESGATVEEGMLLVRLEGGYEAAQLRASEADAELSRLDLDRSRKLREGNTISQAELDSNVAKQQQTEAQVDELKALLAKKTILSPFEGVAGIRMVNLGQFVKAGENIVVFQSLDPIHVNFSLPQQDISKLENGLVVEFQTDAFPDETFTGELTAINPQVEVATRNVLLQGTLGNPKGRLRPGMFGNVSLILPEERKVRLIPQTALLKATSGDSVFVLETDKDDPSLKSVRQQFVRKGMTRGDFVEVTKGLNAGDEVVSAGVFKLRNGGHVLVDNSAEPEASLNPTPEDK